MTQHPGGAPAATRSAGQAFAALFRLLKVARPERPIHPHGLGLSGELTRTGNPAAPSGIDWLDEAGWMPWKPASPARWAFPRHCPTSWGSR